MKPKSLSKIQDEYKRTGRGTKYGNGKLGGYPGLEYTKHLIAPLIPKSEIFVEVFAGKGRIGPLVNAKIKVFNDKNKGVIPYLKHNFSHHIIEELDFIECIKKYDSPKTFLFLDPPWRKKIYENGYIDRAPSEYYQEFFKMVPNLKSNWIICSDVHEKETKQALSKSGYDNKIITSKRTILGRPARVRMCSNIPWIETTSLLNYISR